MACIFALLYMSEIQRLGKAQKTAFSGVRKGLRFCEKWDEKICRCIMVKTENLARKILQGLKSALQDGLEPTTP